MTQISEDEWAYICILARYADQTAHRQKWSFEVEPTEELWAARDEFIIVKMYDNEYVHRLNEVHEFLVHETSDSRSRIDDIFRNFMKV